MKKYCKRKCWIEFTEKQKEWMLYWYTRWWSNKSSTTPY